MVYLGKTMKQQYDVSIIGGGPVGGYLAKTLAKQDVSVALIEEHENPGLPLHCAGLVTPRVLKFLDTDSYDETIQNTITGACIHAPSGKTLTIGDASIRALVIDRQRFDETMINQAQNVGAHLFFNTTFTAAHYSADTIMIHAKQNNSRLDIQSEVLIGADGPRSTVRRLFDFPQPKELLHGMGAGRRYLPRSSRRLRPHGGHGRAGREIGVHPRLYPLTGLPSPRARLQTSCTCEIEHVQDR